MAAESDEAAFERGVSEGRFAALLEAHERRLNKINGSQEQTVKSLSELAMAIQRLFDQAAAAAVTVVATADALEKAEKARRDKGEQSWSPFAKAMTGIGAFAALVGAVLGVYAVVRR